MDATGIICDDELSPAQLNNLERELDCKVMDLSLIHIQMCIRDSYTGQQKAAQARGRIDKFNKKYGLNK